MNRSETIGALAKALAKAQGEIKSAVKDATNPFFRSNYADLPSVVKACKASLAANDIAYIQTTDFLESETWLETILAHSSGEWVSGRYPVRPVKNDPQGMGSAITYARRYALASMVGVVAENEDDDAEADQGRTAQANTIHSSPTMNKDPDVEAGVKNWCDKQRAFLANCETVSDVQDWEEVHKDELGRLKRKALPAWSDLQRAKENRIGAINLAVK